MSTVTLNAAPVSIQPVPVPGPAPSAAPDVGPSGLARPRAEPSPAARSTAISSGGAGLPVLIAAGLLAGGTIAVAPALEGSAAATLAAARGIGAAFGHDAYAATALRDFAAKYRAGAAHVAHLDVRDPHAVGSALGAQAWTSTEELVRGAISGAVMGGSAWAAGKLCGLAASAAQRQVHGER
jgi:hypothetical protein